MSTNAGTSTGGGAGELVAEIVTSGAGGAGGESSTPGGTAGSMNHAGSGAGGLPEAGAGGESSTPGGAAGSAGALAIPFDCIDTAEERERLCGANPVISPGPCGAQWTCVFDFECLVEHRCQTKECLAENCSEWTEPGRTCHWELFVDTCG